MKNNFKINNNKIIYIKYKLNIKLIYLQMRI